MMTMMTMTVLRARLLALKRRRTLFRVQRRQTNEEAGIGVQDDDDDDETMAMQWLHGIKVLRRYIVMR